MGVLVTRALVAPVDTVPDAGGLQPWRPAVDEAFDLRPRVRVPEDRHHDHLDRSDLRRDDQTGIVAMRHDKGTHQASADAP